MPSQELNLGPQEHQRLKSSAMVRLCVTDLMKLLCVFLSVFVFFPPSEIWMNHKGSLKTRIILLITDGASVTCLS